MALTELELARKRRWKSKNKEHVRAYQKRYSSDYRRRKAVELAEKKKWQGILRLYGLTKADYEALLASQNGTCAICKKTSAKYVVDHDHSTEAVRGILCDGCNVGIARLKEDVTVLKNAILYLELK